MIKENPTGVLTLVNASRLALLFVLISTPAALVAARDSGIDSDNGIVRAQPLQTNELQPLLIPAGAVTAAVIAGLFSLLALIISKEQKIGAVARLPLSEGNQGTRAGPTLDSPLGLCSRPHLPRIRAIRMNRPKSVPKS